MNGTYKVVDEKLNTLSGGVVVAEKQEDAIRYNLQPVPEILAGQTLVINPQRDETKCSSLVIRRGRV